MRRVVVTGLGMVTPLGCGVEHTWRRLTAGQSGVTHVGRFDVSICPLALPARSRVATLRRHRNPDQWMEPKERRKVDEFIVFAMCAATQALGDAGWKPEL
jgi:3-oxoacyl-[acyl-carrier-protein] synthase II